MSTSSDYLATKMAHAALAPDPEGLIRGISPLRSEVEDDSTTFKIVTRSGAGYLVTVQRWDV
jgi:hypothetical protein